MVSPADSAVPEDVVEDLKSMAPQLGFAVYQPLIRAYNQRRHAPRREETLFRVGRASRASAEGAGVAPDIVDAALTESGIRQVNPER